MVIQELLKVRGYQVAPAELEGHLLDHPDVADVCVVGVPDEYSGEVPLAFVVLEDGAAKRANASPAEAERIKASVSKVCNAFPVCDCCDADRSKHIQHVSDVKVQYKWLAGGIEFIDAIPKNPSGKLLRRFLRDRAKEIIAKRPTKSKL